jgi:hypothetical protein
MGPISIRLCINHPWEEWIQVCSNEEGVSCHQGEIIAQEKNTENFLKIFLSRASQPISIKLGTSHPGIRPHKVNTCI